MNSNLIYRDSSQLNPLTRIFLTFFSKIYALVSQLRNNLYDREIFARHTLPGKVISVGNLVVGGTGKSPFVISLAKYLAREGFFPAIVTRGHGSHLRKDESMVLLNGDTIVPPQRTSKTTADEAMMQSKELVDLPVIIGSNRIEAVQRFVKHSPKLSQKVTHWILDDGFQHRRINRNVDVVLLDSHYPFGNGHLLPMGSLREPIHHLKRGHLVVFTRSDENIPHTKVVDYVKALGIDHVFMAPMKVEAPLLVKGRATKSVADQSVKVAIVSAIARPERFIQSLKIFGIKVNERYFLPDHWTFDVEKIRSLSRKNDAIITTAKDYWRDPKVFDEIDVPVYVLPIHFEIDSQIFQFISKFL